MLEHKLTHAHGAALFWTLPRKRNMDLLRLLVAYELIWDFLDNLSERAVSHGRTDGRDLHMAIVEAVDPGAPITDYYSRHPWREDAGYLRALVETCRECCVRLPCYSQVQHLVVREAHRAQVLALNHQPDPAIREAVLRRWVSEEYPGGAPADWWEISGAASAPLTIHALLAQAAEPSCTDGEIAAVYRAYFPWLSAATTMLDSYVDQLEDLENGDHSYVAHYPDPELAILGISDLVLRSVSEARALRGGHRHAVIAACMISMYLSKETSPTPEMHRGARSFARAGGSLTMLLLPILRVWRVAFSQRTA